jgi:hypothetical protein
MSCVQGFATVVLSQVNPSCPQQGFITRTNQNDSVLGIPAETTGPQRTALTVFGIRSIDIAFFTGTAIGQCAFGRTGDDSMFGIIFKAAGGNAG